MKRCLLFVLFVFSYFTRLYAIELIFGNNKPGYLYNIGGKGYVFSVRVNEMGEESHGLILTSKPENAMSVRIIRKMFKGITYHTISPRRGTCSNLDLYRNTADCVFKYSRKLANRTGFTLDSESNTFMNYFMFSPPLTKGTNAFQIYNQGQCITADSAGVLDLADCIDSSSKARENQLFMWVDNKWFDKGMKLRKFPRAL